MKLYIKEFYKTNKSKLTIVLWEYKKEWVVCNREADSYLFCKKDVFSEFEFRRLGIYDRNWKILTFPSEEFAQIWINHYETMTFKELK